MSAGSGTVKQTHPKKGGATQEEQTTGTKVVKAECLTPGQAADIGKAPPSRVYTKDYSKVPEQGDKDDVTRVLGNPLRW